MSRMWMLRAATAGTLLVAGAAAAQECTPSKWGPEDEIGSANLVTPERVRAAATLVRQGRSQPLGIVIDSSTPAFAPRGLSLQVVQPNQQGGQRLTEFGYDAVYNDDVAHLWFGIGSQIDGLGHLAEDGIYYNCNDEKDFAALTGLTRLGVHNVPPLIGRGVVIDMADHFGEPFLPAGRGFGAQALKAAAADQGVEIRAGDVVLLHTGWTDAKLESAPQEWVNGEPGILPDAAEYLASLDVMAVGADTWGVDVVPPPEGVNEFMFVLGQARVRGTVQMIVNPVAMW